MKSSQYDFTVIGGDLRQVYLKEELRSRGYAVCHYGLCTPPDPGDAACAVSLAQALSMSPVVLAPIPLASKDPQKGLILSDLLDGLSPGQRLFAGCIPASFSGKAKTKGIRLFDYMEDEELAIYNSIATAEGAIAEAITKSTRNLHKSSCLVLGYGKCGKTLAACLKGLFCRVTVCARSPRARAEAAVTADHVLSLDELDERLGNYHFIFNTIPFQLLDVHRLGMVNREAVILDLASAPGGLDSEAAAAQNLSAFQCPGLPGKYAPRSSADAIADTILHTLTPQISDS